MKNLLFVILFLYVAKFLGQEIKNVDAATFKSMIDEKKYVLIDLRTDQEVQKRGMIPGALQIDYLAKDSEAQILSLDKSKGYLVYCAGGGRSSECAGQMQKAGFSPVINLEEGYDDWKRKGYETIKK